MAFATFTSVSLALGSSWIVMLAHAARVEVDEHNFQETQVHSAEKCTEAKMENVCVCDKKTMKRGGGWQCSECKNKMKWGYGCELDCPCEHGCDFSGNCVFPEFASIANCKRNSRVDKPTTTVLNDRGECQACISEPSGFWGKRCEHACPVNCAMSPEGACTRGGACYVCKEGFYGETCDQTCPKYCPKCAKYDIMLDDEFLPAGSCLTPCKGNTFGKDCTEECPKGCKLPSKKDKASCRREDGRCKKCNDGLWGAKCDVACNRGCAGGAPGVGGACQQLDDDDEGVTGGTCLNGCTSGFWGSACAQKCPEFTVAGCNRKTGLPDACSAKHFPGYTDETQKLGICKSCSLSCKDQECGAGGVCSAGCVEGFFGKTCEKSCPVDCAGGCDGSSGQCNACPAGLTGKFCEEKCHGECKSCKQFGPVAALARPGTARSDCLSCREEDEPVEFDAKKGTCGCIEDSDRLGAKCKCNQPADGAGKWEGYYDSSSKKCRINCATNYKGKPLQKVVGKCGRTDCIPIKVYNHFVVAYHSNEGDDAFEKLGGKGEEGCSGSQYAAKDHEGQVHCVSEDHVRFILNLDIPACDK